MQTCILQYRSAYQVLHLSASKPAKLVFVKELFEFVGQFVSLHVVCAHCIWNLGDIDEAGVLQGVGGALDAATTAVEYVGVDQMCSSKKEQQDTDVLQVI